MPDTARPREASQPRAAARAEVVLRVDGLRKIYGTTEVVRGLSFETRRGECFGTGMVCQSAMFTSSFEAMYSAFSRMHMQRTWDAIINAPISLDDVVFAEWIWAASKAVLSTAAILAVIMAMGFGHTWYALWIVPLGFLVGLTFGAFGLVTEVVPTNIMLHIAVLLGYALVAYYVALVLTRRRLLR